MDGFTLMEEVAVAIKMVGTHNLPIIYSQLLALS